jgi:hypothetical protein
MKLQNCLLSLIAAVLVASLPGCEIQPTSREETSRVNPLEEALRAPASIARQEGIAAAILMDVSGSMEDSVKDSQGTSMPKIEIARRAVLTLLGQFDDFAKKDPNRPVLVGVYEFSTRDRQPSCRQVIPLGKPDLANSTAEVGKMVPDGGTPIGDAMIKAKRDLDATGMSRRHILVVTDGENNRGYSPGAVANAIARQPEQDRASIYFVAFNVAANVFNDVKEAGGLVLAANSENDLRQTLDFILTGKILVERP